MFQPMIRTEMREILPTTAQLWREIAQLVGGAIMANDRSDKLCKLDDIKRSQSNWPTIHCHYRYPSPRRSGPFWVRPTPPSFDLLETLHRFVGLVQKTLVLTTQSAVSSWRKTKQKKGSSQCFTSVLFSPLRPSRHFRHVSTTILSAALPALQLVPSSQTHWVATLSQVPSLVALLVRCVTKSRAFAAKLNKHLSVGAANNFDRRSGTPCAAVLHFPTNIFGDQSCSRKS
jgi:hypothetical protein